MGQAPPQPARTAIHSDGRRVGSSLASAGDGFAPSSSDRQCQTDFWPDGPDACSSYGSYGRSSSGSTGSGSVWGESSSSSSVAGPPSPAWPRHHAGEVSNSPRTASVDAGAGSARANMAMELATILEDDDVPEEGGMRLPSLTFGSKTPRGFVNGRHGMHHRGVGATIAAGGACVAAASGDPFAGDVACADPSRSDSAEGDEASLPELRQKILVSEGDWEVHIHRVLERQAPPNKDKAHGKRLGASSSRTAHPSNAHTGGGDTPLLSSPKDVMHDAISATAAIVDRARATAPSTAGYSYRDAGGGSLAAPQQLLPPQPAGVQEEEDPSLDSDDDDDHITGRPALPEYPGRNQAPTVLAAARHDRRAEFDKLDQDTEVPSLGETPRSQGTDSLPSEGFAVSFDPSVVPTEGRVMDAGMGGWTMMYASMRPGARKSQSRTSSR